MLSSHRKRWAQSAVHIVHYINVLTGLNKNEERPHGLAKHGSTRLDLPNLYDEIAEGVLYKANVSSAERCVGVSVPVRLPAH